MHHQLLIHVVWTTRERVPAITFARAKLLAEELPRIAREERVQILAIGVVSTHLHLILRIHPTTSIPKLLQRMKGGTAHLINGGTAIRAHHLRWAKGYTAITVSPRSMEIAIDYVRSQHLRHPDEAIAGWPSTVAEDVDAHCISSLQRKHVWRWFSTARR